MTVFAGTFAASVTPLRDGGDAVDVNAVAGVADRLVAGGVDGIFALGTTGEGVLLDPGERETVAAAFVVAARRRVRVIVHCGAQSTRDTERLSAHAAAVGADGVAVIAPPYFALDDAALTAHLVAAARACAPLPFFVYEFADRSGYPVPPRVVGEVRERAQNLAGLKVSDSPWEAVSAYLGAPEVAGLRLFVGTEGLLDRALAAGAAGVVSGLAAALPELVVEAVRAGTEPAARRMAEVRALLAPFPTHAALKRLLAASGVTLEEAVRRPLRGLDGDERRAVDGIAVRLAALRTTSRG